MEESEGSADDYNLDDSFEKENSKNIDEKITMSEIQKADSINTPVKSNINTGPTDQKIITNIKTKFFARTEESHNPNHPFNAKVKPSIDYLKINPQNLSENDPKTRPASNKIRKSDDSDLEDVNLSENDHVSDEAVPQVSQPSKKENSLASVSIHKDSTDVENDTQAKRKSGMYMKRPSKSFLTGEEESSLKEKESIENKIFLITNITNITTTNITPTITQKEEDTFQRRASGIQKKVNFLGINENTEISKSQIIKKNKPNEESQAINKEEDIITPFQQQLYDQYQGDDKCIKEEAENLEDDEENENVEEEQDDVVYDDMIQDNMENSFLKEMLIETNRHFIKDKQNNEEKIKQASAGVFFSVIFHKIKTVNMYSFLMIKNYQMPKIKNCITALRNCIEMHKLKKKEILRNYLKKLKHNCEMEKIRNNNLVTQKLQSVVKELDIFQDIEKQNDTREIMKILYEKISKYAKASQIINESSVVVASIPVIPQISEVKPTAIPAVPGIASGVPSIPSIPGGPRIPIPPGMKAESSSLIEEMPKPPKDMVAKKLNWSIIPKNKINNTFWVANKSEPTVDYDNLTKHFCEPKKKEDEKKDTQNDDTKKLEQNSPAVVKILEDKRLMNLGIALTKVPFKNDDLKVIIETFDPEEKLDVEMIDKIISLTPNNDEIAKLKAYSGDLKLISHGERFCKMLTTIENFQKKLECLRYKKTLEIEKNEIMNKLKLLKDSLNSVKTSDHFITLLKLILRIGNYLNADTNKGNAQGIFINVLSLLENVKGFSKEKYSLLEFLVLNVKTKEPSLINFHIDFLKIEESMQIDQTDLDAKIKEFECGLNKIKKEKDIVSKSKETADSRFYLKFLTELQNSANDKFDEVMALNDSLLKEIEAVAMLFGEEARAFKLVEFFKVIHDFVTNYKKTLQKISAEEVKQLKKQIKEEKNKQANIKDKFAKDFEKIRNTVTRKTLARKTLMKNINKEKIKDIINEEKVEISQNKDRNTNPIMKHSLAQHLRNSDKLEKMKNTAGREEDRKVLSIVPEVVENVKKTSGRITKNRITSYKKNNTTEDDGMEDDPESFGNDFLMINQPLKISNTKIGKFNPAKKSKVKLFESNIDLFSRSDK